MRARASECASLTRASSRGLGARRCSLLSCNGTSGKKAFEALCRQLPDEIWTPPCIVLCHMIEALRRQLPDEEIWVRRANATIRFYRTDGPFAKRTAPANIRNAPRATPIIKKKLMKEILILKKLFD